MLLKSLIFFTFVQISLLLPSYSILRLFKTIHKNDAVLICLSYVLSLVLFSVISIFSYVYKLDHQFLHFAGWAYILTGITVFILKKYYLEMKKFIVPISALVALSLVSLFFIGLNFTSNVNYIPDPEPISNSNYNVLSVKVLNVSHTNANDNYVPFRQAQFIINRLDPATSSFIDEWGVHFFQRTPLMGAVSAFYFDLFMSKPPIDYLWRTSATDPSNTYLQFQIIATILNSLLLIPAYYLIKKLFNSKTAYISLLFLASSHFFLYNSFYTWPKSLVAFFILFSWYLLLENKLRFTILAGIVSAAAYLTHDLAFLYIVASLFMLLYKKRFRDIVIVLGITVFSALPWLITSSVIFKKASTFYLYPISVENIPQPGREKEIMSKFFKTSIWELFMIRIRTLTYLLTPYSILDIKPLALSNRLWGVGIYSITGALGLGLIIPAIIGLIKNIKRYPVFILIFTPIMLIAIIFGWSYPGSIGAIHFAQPIIVILVGCGVWYLLGLKSKTWILVIFFINLIYCLYIMIYSYDFAVKGWFYTPKSIISLLSIFFIFVTMSLILWRYLAIKFVNRSGTI